VISGNGTVVLGNRIIEIATVGEDCVRDLCAAVTASVSTQECFDLISDG
jgi:hypothetical protein